MRKYVSATVTVFCRGCGSPRVLTQRSARRAGLCSECRYPPPEPEMKDRYRRWWFDRFNDNELSLMASELAGRVIPAARIATHRQALVASGSLKDPDGVESVGERQARSLLSPPR